MGKNQKIIFILILALVLRLINLNQSLWLDEAAQVIMSSKSFSFQWFGRVIGDFHPPLFYLLSHFLLKVSKAEWFLRLPSVFSGVATVYLVFLIGKKFFNEKVALLTSLFLAISPFHIYYSQELRMYSLAAFLATLSTFFFLNSSWFGYFLVSTVLIYTHYLGGFLFLSHFFWVLFFGRSVFKKWLKTMILVFVFYLPWFPQLLKQLTSGLNLVKVLPGWKATASLSPAKAFPLTIFKFAAGRISFEDRQLYLAIIIVVLSFYFFLFYRVFRRMKLKKLFLLNWFLIPLFAGWLISFFIPLFQPFRFLFLIVPFELLVALGVLSLKRGWRKIALSGVLFINLSGLFFYYSNPSFQRENWREATAFIQSQNPHDSVIIFKFSDAFAPYQWYARAEIPFISATPLGVSQEVIFDRLSNGTVNKKNVFLFQYLGELTDPEAKVEKWLKKEGYQKIETKDFSGVGFVYNYRKEVF